MGITVFGAVFVDVKGYPKDTFIPAGRNVGVVETVYGGVSRNIAENIANVELRPTFVSLVDDNAEGDEVINQLKRHKVNTDYIRKTKDGMGTWLAIFDNSGDVYASISKRPDLAPILQILEEKGDEIIKNSDSIALEIDMDKEIVKEVFKLADKHGKKVYAAVSNMSIASKRRDFIKDTGCFVCNRQEAGMLFMDDYSEVNPEDLKDIIYNKATMAGIPKMVVTLGEAGAIYAEAGVGCGICPSRKVEVRDTTGAGDAFFSGVTIGLTYGKSLAEACAIGSMLAASVITSTENVCPRFLPSEFGIEIKE